MRIPVLAVVFLLTACSEPAEPISEVPVTPETKPESEPSEPQPAVVPPPRPDSVPDSQSTPELPAVEVAEVVVEETEVSDSKESAFDSNQWNSAVGLGGGAGGKYGGRAGSRRGGEQYAAIEEHAFRDSHEHPLSTFAIDVDGASWSNTRRFLQDGALPPADSVRVEEFINWFRYGDAAPAASAEHPVALHTEVAACPWREGHQLLRVVLRTREIELDRLPPRNIVFLVDVSGSMQSADKLPLLKRGLRLLARQMREQDRVAIVTYAANARVALEPTSGAQRETIDAAIASLQSGGGTNGEGGIRVAYELARKTATDESINRVLLATDGDFNVGVSDDDELVKLIESERDDGVFLSVLGFGTGNLKDAKLESLGRHGNGQYSYIDTIAEARRVLVEQSGATLVAVAKDVKVQIEFNPRFVAGYRQIGYENRRLEAREFNDDNKDAGEMGAGHFVTALYEIVPAGKPLPGGAVDPLRYQSNDKPAPRLGEDTAARDELLTVKVRYKHPAADVSKRFDAFVAAADSAAPSADFRFASAVAAFGMILHESEHIRDFGLEQVAALAASARGEDPHGERAEFLRLVQMAEDLVTTEDQRR